MAPGDQECRRDFIPQIRHLNAFEPDIIMKIVIILPTYNESDNIRLLIPALVQQFAP